DPLQRTIAGSGATLNAFGSVSLAVFLLYLSQSLALDAGTIGLLLALGGVGGVVGALLATTLSRRLGLTRAILWSAALMPLAEVLDRGSRGAGGARLGLVGAAAGVVAWAFGRRQRRSSPAAAGGRPLTAHVTVAALLVSNGHEVRRELPADPDSADRPGRLAR